MSYLSTCLYFPIADCPCCREVVFINAVQDNLSWQKAVKVLGMMLYFLHPPPFLTGKSYTMIGKDDSMQNLGIIPCAISWLFKLINERKEKTGARFSVRISAVEVWGKEENLRDLLSEVATGSLQDGQSPGVYLCEDPICGMQVNPRLILH